jgi:hypothetical protein
MKLDPTLVGDRPLSAVSVAAHATARGASAVDVGDDVDNHRPLRRERLRDLAADLAGFSTRMPSAPDRKNCLFDARRFEQTRCMLGLA